MHLIPLVLATTALVNKAYSQTPPGTSPSTEKTLSVFYGTTQDFPGITLPLSRKTPNSTPLKCSINILTVVSKIPTITYPSATPNQTYQALLVDLSIKAAQVNLSSLVPNIQTPLAPGINTNRTTRVHYWQTGLTFTSNGTLVNTTTPIAFYQPPAPPPGDIAHTYVFYLFEQTALFAPPPVGNPFSEALVNKGMGSRLSFSVNHLAAENGTGPLVGATYFTAQNMTGSATGSATGTGSVASPTAAVFRGAAGRSQAVLAGVAMAIVAALFAVSYFS